MGEAASGGVGGGDAQEVEKFQIMVQNNILIWRLNNFRLRLRLIYSFGDWTILDKDFDLHIYLEVGRAQERHLQDGNPGLTLALLNK